MRHIKSEADARLLTTAIWPGLRPMVFDEYMPFLEYFDAEFSAFQKLCGQLLTITDVYTALELVQNHPLATKSELSAMLIGTLSLPQTMHSFSSDILDFCARIVTTCNVRSKSDVGLEIDVVQINHTPWPAHESLKSVTARWFRDEQTSSQDKTLDAGIDMPSLKSICGLKFVWTSNLLDHLRLDRSTKSLMVYGQTAFLIKCLRAGITINGTNLRTGSSGGLVPYETIVETLDSLNLLFPAGNSGSSDLLGDARARNLSQLGPDRYRVRYGLSYYPVWGSRLLQVESFLKSAVPRQTFKKSLLNLWEYCKSWEGWFNLFRGVAITFYVARDIYKWIRGNP